MTFGMPGIRPTGTIVQQAMSDANSLTLPRAPTKGNVLIGAYCDKVGSGNATFSSTGTVWTQVNSYGNASGAFVTCGLSVGVVGASASAAVSASISGSTVMSVIEVAGLRGVVGQVVGSNIIGSGTLSVGTILDVAGGMLFMIAGSRSVAWMWTTPTGIRIADRFRQDGDSVHLLITYIAPYRGAKIPVTVLGSDLNMGAMAVVIR